MWVLLPRTRNSYLAVKAILLFLKALYCSLLLENERLLLLGAPSQRLVLGAQAPSLGLDGAQAGR